MARPGFGIAVVCSASLLCAAWGSDGRKLRGSVNGTSGNATALQWHPLEARGHIDENGTDVILGAAESSGTQYLAQSWRVDSSQPYLVAPGRQLFTADDDDMFLTPFRKVDTEEYSSNSAEDFANQISMALDVSGQYGDAAVGNAFTASAQMSLDRVRTSNKKQYRYDQIIKATVAHMSSRHMLRHKELRPDVKDFLLTAEPSVIHQTLGDFYATEVFVGGVFQMTVTTVERASDTKTEMNSAIKADMESVLSSASVSLSVGGSVSSEISSREMTTKVQAMGGDTTIWLALSEDNMDTVKADWAATIDDTNAFPIGFKLSPLWVLLDNADMSPLKAKELKTYMTNKWAEDAARVPAFEPDTDMPTPAPTPRIEAYNGWYSLENGQSGKYAVVDCWQDRYCKHGTRVHQWGHSRFFPDNKKWYIRHVGGGRHTIKTARANVHLGIQGGSLAWGSTAELRGGADASAQWRISCVGVYCTIRNVKSGLWLNVAGASADNGAAIIQWGDDKVSNSKWKLNKV